MAKNITYDTEYLRGVVDQKDLESIFPEIEKAHLLLEKREGSGKDFLGWLDLPKNISEGLLKDIETTANFLSEKSDAIIIIGIGGSYLGAKATIDTLGSGRKADKIAFAGYNLSGGHLEELLEELKDKDFSVNVISKSGTTTEPAVAFRIFEDLLHKKYGSEEAKKRIVCTTDSEKGALKAIADKKGYKSFVIPNDIGGRFSVLTPVGLFPVACAGIDIRELIAGAKAMMDITKECDLDKNICYRYAAARNVLYRKGKRVEILANFDSKMHYIDEWWKQLFGESEGKDARSIFPVSCDYSTDLHSMGQLIQEGERNLFETFIITEDEKVECIIPRSEDDMDNLNYLAGKKVSYVNRKAYEATCEAHFEGAVPNSTIFLPGRTPFHIGQLFYFFEKAVGISAHVAGVNPFDQPGVEAYKSKMFKLLGKPGV